MATIINVNTGEVKVGTAKSVLRAMALGSCVAVIAYDKKTKIGGMAHVMLPGCAPAPRKHQEKRYALEAIGVLLHRLERLGACPRDILVCLIGAGNVLQRDEDTVCASNIESVRSILRAKEIRIVAEDLGGDKRRSACLHNADGKAYSTQGDGAEKLLWSF